MPDFSGLRINGVDYNIAGGGGTGSVTGVKGAQESTYRTGNVNLTPANIGALPSTTTLADLSDDATHRTVTDTEKATWNGKADTSDIPTKTSDLTNDSDFITGLVVLTYNVSTWQEFLDAFNANKLVFCRVPTGNRARYAFLAFYNGDEHSAEFQYYRSISTHTDTDQGDEVYVYKLTSYSNWSTTTRKTYSKVNVTSGGGLTKAYQSSAITLAIDDAYASFTNYYTKSQVNDLISAITTVSFEIVQTLPSTGEANVIYLVQKTTTQTQNVYDEYIYVDNAWEKIGDTEIDLSNYYTKTEADTLLANKVDKVSGKGLSTNDYTTAEKTKLAGITEGADVTPPVFGSILIDDSDVLGPNYVLDMLKIKSGENVNLDVDYINRQLVINATDTTYEDATTSTHGLMTASDKTKLNGIASGAEVNVQSDWNQTITSHDAYIKNKPTNLVQDASYVHTDNNYTTDEKNKLAGIASGAEVNVQSDWNVSDTSSDAFIKNKPTIPNVATKYDSSDATEATLADDDKVPFYDTSATSRRNSTWANIKAKLKSYFDGLYLTLTNPTGSGSITMNPPSNYVAGSQSVSLGQQNNASGGQSVAMGYGNESSADWAVAIGSENIASYEYAVAIGLGNEVTDSAGVAIGEYNKVDHNDSFVFGDHLICNWDLQVIIGRWNNNKSSSLFELGNGGNENARANALEVDRNNNLKVYGTITDGNGNVLSNKQEKLVSGTNIKTINSTSLLGSGNIAVQPTLVSGTNIKTINNQSILGSGNITISAGGATWGAIGGTLSNQTDLQTALDNKQAKLVSGTNIKTVGGTSLLGSGNIAVGLTPYVLWTNPSPTADFAAQTVTLSQTIANFTYYSVVYKNTSGGERYNSTGLIPVGVNAQMRISTNYNFTRNIDFSGTSATIAACLRYTTYGSTSTSTQNGYCIPYQIIGWK